MAIDHMGIPVSDIRRSRASYEAALKPLELMVMMEIGPDETESGGTAIGFGPKETNGLFWIGDNERVGEGLYIAFEAPTCDAVDCFYEAVLAAGGRDNGKPGLRPNHGSNYYAAFVHDPDDANIEVVCDLAK